MPSLHHRAHIELLGADGVQGYGGGSHGEGGGAVFVELKHLLAERQPHRIPPCEAVLFLLVADSSGALAAPSGKFPGDGEQYPGRRQRTRSLFFLFSRVLLAKVQGLGCILLLF